MVLYTVICSKKDQQFLKNKILWEILYKLVIKINTSGWLIKRVSRFLCRTKSLRWNAQTPSSRSRAISVTPRAICVTAPGLLSQHCDLLNWTHGNCTKTCSLWAWTSLSICYFQPGLPFLSARKAWMGSPANSAGGLCTNGFLSELWLQERDTNT